MLELFYSSGIRREEMTRLTLPDVDIINGFVRVTRGKGLRDRVVPIGRAACEALAGYLKNARNVWLKAPRNQFRTPGPVAQKRATREPCSKLTHAASPPLPLTIQKRSISSSVLPRVSGTPKATNSAVNTQAAA